MSVTFVVVYSSELVSLISLSNAWLIFNDFSLCTILPGWYASSSNQLSGVTQGCLSTVRNQKDVTYFSHPFNVRLSCSLNNFQGESGKSEFLGLRKEFIMYL